MKAMVVLFSQQVAFHQKLGTRKDVGTPLLYLSPVAPSRARGGEGGYPVKKALLKRDSFCRVPFVLQRSNIDYRLSLLWTCSMGEGASAEDFGVAPMMKNDVYFQMVSFYEISGGRREEVEEKKGEREWESKNNAIGNFLRLDTTASNSLQLFQTLFIFLTFSAFRSLDISQ